MKRQKLILFVLLIGLMASATACAGPADTDAIEAA